MPRATLPTLGAFTLQTGGGVTYYTWEGSVQIPGHLTDNGSPSYLRGIQIGEGTISIQISATSSGSGSPFGPDLHRNWENYYGAVIFDNGDFDTVTLIGPNWSGIATLSDTSEPYSWNPTQSSSGQSANPDAATSAELEAWFASNYTDTDLTITLDDGETLPVAHAGSNQTVNAGAGVTLNGSASVDPDGGSIVSYLWEHVSGTSVTLSGANTATATFTAPSTAGNIDFRLTVTDDEGDTASAFVRVTVQVPAPPPPTPITNVDLQGSINAGAVGLSGTLSKEALVLLTLADFDSSGLEVVTLALLTAGIGTQGSLRNIYNSHSNWADSGSILDGSLQLSGTTTSLVRIGFDTSTLRFNDSDGSFHIGNYFNTGGDGDDLTAYFQTTADNVTSTAELSSTFTAGLFEHSVNFNITPVVRSFLNGISNGQRFIFALARPAPLITDVDLQGSINAGAVGLSGALSTDTVNIQGSIDLGGVTLSGVLFRDVNIRSSIDVGTVALSGTVTKEPIFGLHSFDTTDLRVEFAALISIGAGDTYYATPPRGTAGSLDEGDLSIEVGANSTVITRIRKSNNRLILNDDDSPNPLNLGSYFNSGDPDFSLYVQTSQHLVELPVSSLQGTGANNVRWSFTTELTTLFNAVSSGDKVIFALAQRIPARLIAGSIDAGSVTLAGVLFKQSTVVDLQGSIDVGTVTLSGALPKIEIPITDVEAEGSIDVGTVTLIGALSTVVSFISINGSIGVGAISLSGTLSRLRLSSLKASLSTRHLETDLYGSIDSGATSLKGVLSKGGDFTSLSGSLSGSLPESINIVGHINLSSSLSGIVYGASKDSTAGIVLLKGLLSTASFLTGELDKISDKVTLKGTLDKFSELIVVPFNVKLKGTLSKDRSLSTSERISLVKSRRGWFYINLSKPPSRLLYDVSRLMEYSEGVYDDFTSYFIEEMRKLPSAGTYRVEEDNRPDIYSDAIYGSTDFWYILLLYNNIVLVSDMKRGDELRYPSKARLEDVYSSLRTAENRGVLDVI